MAETLPPVIVCDDNEDDRALALRMISRLRPGVPVESCADGEACAERLAREPFPSLVLMDYRMPRLRGDEVLRRVSPRLREAGARLVLFCADLTPAEVQTCLAAGAHEWVHKPSDYAEYRTVMEGILNDAIPAASVH